MRQFILPEGFVVHVNGVPVELATDTLVNSATDISVPREWTFGTMEIPVFITVIDEEDDQ